MSGLYINKFVDRLQQCELKGQKDFVCPIADAKNLHNDITKMLVELENNRNNNKVSEEVIVEIGGGSF